ncbi:hypothetical protein ACWDR0_24810 [Streptomyces sp. NPDC003691]
MTPRPRTAVLGSAALTAALLTGCGVQPTGVLDAGAPAGGITTGHRLYFVSQTGRLEAVPRPETRSESVEDPNGVLKGLLSGPHPDERKAGLITLVRDEGDDQGYVARTGGDGRIFVAVPHYELHPSSVADRNLMGQLVCSIGRSRAVLGGGKQRTDDIKVTLLTGDGTRRAHVCSDFMK